MLSQEPLHRSQRERKSARPNDYIVYPFEKECDISNREDPIYVIQASYYEP